MEGYVQTGASLVVALQKADVSLGIADPEDGDVAAITEAAKNDQAIGELQQMLKGVTVK